MVKTTGGHEPILTTVSAMTAALAGYEEFCSMHESDVVAISVNHFYEAATRHIFQEDGTVIACRGGSLTAIWHAPQGQNDHALRAARAASAIAALDGPFGGLLVSVGVATGAAMVGVIGSSVRRSYSAVGRPMTDSERLSALAGPGEAYIDESTWKGSKGQVQAEAIPGIQRVGGITREETVYRLVTGP